MWVHTQYRDNQFKDRYQLKIKGIRPLPIEYTYQFEPNQNYDIPRIIHEVDYLMKFTDLAPTEWYPVRHLPTQTILESSPIATRLDVLLSCIHHMTEDAVYQYVPPSTKIRNPMCLRRSYSIYGSYVLYAFIILFLVLLRNKPIMFSFFLVLGITVFFI